MLLPSILPRPTTHQEDGTTDGNNAADPAQRLPFLNGTLKTFAYFGGPAVLDFMLYGFLAGRVAPPDLTM